MKQRRWRLPLLLLLFMLAGGCLRLEQKYPERMSYALTTARTPMPAPASGPTLHLQPFRILPPYNRSSFVYRYDTVRFEADHYHQFLSPPDQLLHGEVQRWLAAAGIFAAVSGRGGDGWKADLLLEGSVVELYGDYQLRNEPKAVVAIDFTLYDGARTALLWRRSYRQELTIADSTAAALAASWRQGLTLILIALEGDLLQTLDLGR